MANVQIENGYTKIANQILENIVKLPLNGTQLKIIIVIWRNTYGFSRKQAELSESYICKATGIDRRNIRREISELITKNIVVVVKEADFTNPRIIKFNKDYEKWVRANLSPEGKYDTEGEMATTPGGELATTPGGELTPQQRKILNKELKKDEHEHFFESIWNLYPNKKGKAKIKDAQKKKLYNIGLAELGRCIERYKKNKPEWQAWQNGSTFFNTGYTDYLDANFQDFIVENSIEPRTRGW